MTAVLELPDDRPRELVRVQRQVRERHHLVVATVIQEHRQLRRELRREVFSHGVLVHLPLLSAPEGRCDEEQPRNGLRRLFFAEVLQQDRAAQRMPHEEYFPVQRGELSRDPVPPCPVLGTTLMRHLRAPHVVLSAQSTTQGCRQLLVFLVRPLPAAVDEQDSPSHSLSLLLFAGFSGGDTRRRGPCRDSSKARGTDGWSKKTKTAPPGASHLSTMPRARSGSRSKRPTRTAKILSKRRSPRSS